MGLRDFSVGIGLVPKWIDKELQERMQGNVGVCGRNCGWCGVLNGVLMGNAKIEFRCIYVEWASKAVVCQSN